MGGKCSMLRIAVCDDDFETFQHIESLLVDFEINHVMDQEISLGVEDYYPNGDAFLSGIKQNIYDVVFMDIEVGKEKGTEIVRKMHNLTYNIKTIFISNHTDYFRELAEVGLFSFLLKPITKKDFTKVMLRVINALQDERELFVVNQYKSKFKIPIAEIMYIEKDNRKTIIVTRDSTFHLSKTLSTVIKELNSSYFIAPNSSSAINYNYIDQFTKKEIIMSDGKWFPISERRRKNIQLKYFSLRKEKICL